MPAFQNILVAVVGLTPQVITETIYYLTHSIFKFFVLDALPRGVVAVSLDLAPDGALAPSFFGRPLGQLP